MRFMMIVKANKQSEAGEMPTDDMINEMGKYNEELMKAGMLIELSGLESSAKGARVKFSGSNRTVVSGPFPNIQELIAGFWLIKANSKDEVIEWAKRVPFKNGEEIEIRRLFDVEDFAPCEGIERAKKLGKELEESKS